MYKIIYPSLIREFDIEVEHIFTEILEGLKAKGVRFMGRAEDREVVTYQDSCFLARKCGIVEEPRMIIDLIGGRIIEMKNNKRDAFCCGAAGGVIVNEPEIAKGAAQILVKGIPKEATKMVCGSSLCFSNIISVEDSVTDFSIFILSKLRSMGI